MPEISMTHTISISAPPDRVWKTLTDLEAVVPCMPGATLTSTDGESFTGAVKIKVGAIGMTYRGEGRFTERDERERRAALEVSGKDARGSGTARADVVITLADSDGGTTATVQTRLTVTGKAAQFGRGLLDQVGGAVLTQFAGNLSARLDDGTPSVPTLVLSPSLARTVPDATAAAPGAPRETGRRATTEGGSQLSLSSVLGPVVKERVQSVPGLVGALLIGLVLGRFLAAARPGRR
ncbi:SRPBCC family protein [Pseudonocardia sp. CA-107938]|uniref:SRPBCC family protein n=1 Tax=Pseudonocardia sp. CA-107938 TaxID=3240021 RepID=UPI003D92789D